MAGDNRPPGTITLDELRGMVDRPARITDQEIHEAAVAALNGLRGMNKATKGRVIRRMLKILSA
jgi:hypothetical protein